MIVIVWFLWLPFLNAQPDESNGSLSMGEITAKYGYPYENYSVTTEDGYILTIGRIPHRDNGTCSGQNEPILLHHAARQKGDSFLIAGVDESLAFLLANNCYDVWIPNHRGTIYSLNHMSLSHENKNYWDFTMNEEGRYDMKSVVDLILETTKAPKISYIGFSQGCAIFLIFLHYHPEFAERVRQVHFMAPAVFLSHCVPYSWLPQKNLIEISKIAWELTAAPLPADPEMFQKFIQEVCQSAEKCSEIFDFEYSNDETKVLRRLTDMHAESFNVRQIFHFAQIYFTDEFKAYDFGPSENQRRYNHPTPPHYNLSQTKMPVHIYHGMEDAIVVVEDVKRLASKLPDVRLRIIIPHSPVTHYDFLLGGVQKELTYNLILKFLLGE